MNPPELNRPDTRRSVALHFASGRTFSREALYWTLQCSGWFCFGVLGFTGDLRTKGVRAAALENVAWLVAGFLVSACFRWPYRRARAVPRSYGRHALTCLVLCAAAAPLWYDGTELLMRCGYHLVHVLVHPVPQDLVVAERNDARAPWLIAVSYWMFYFVILLTWSSLYFGVNAMLDLEAERANVARAMKLADAARLRALQSNLNPHFLFNALNGIATLIREGDAAAGSAMIDSLSDFLRSTLERINSPEISVREELDLVQQYLHIQRFRFGSRLHATVDADPGTLEALIPTLILQPLVENALRHGILPREDGGSLVVSVRRDAADLSIRVEDDGPGPPPGSDNPVGVGLANCRDRLDALYGSAARLTTGRCGGGGGFSVHLSIPYR